MVSVEERFLRQINKTDTCWLWTGYLERYGRLTIVKGYRVLAHRYSYEYHYGPIPEGLNVLHRCDNPACVNPEHLFLGTQKDNVQDMINKGRWVPPTGRWDRRIENGSPPRS